MAIFSLFRVVLLSLALVTTQEPARQEFERAELTISSGPIYVGQGLEGKIRLRSEEHAPTPVWPKLEGGEVEANGDVEQRPISATGIGDRLQQITEYSIPVRIVPNRAGTLNLPPLILRGENHLWQTTARRIEVRPIPMAGRLRTFLGGVGKIVASAEATPRAARVGEEIDYAIRLEGPGAVGSSGLFDLQGLEKLEPAFRVERGPIEEKPGKVPSLTARFRLKGTRAGRAVLPPVLVSWFDPNSNSFQTSVARAMAVTVVDVPVLPSESVAVPGIEPKSADSRRFLVRAAILASVILMTMAAIVLIKARSRRPLTADRIARRMAADLSKIDDPTALAREIPRGFASFFEIIAGRPPGVLTPGEAKIWAERIAGPDPGERLSALISRCDRVTYGGETDEASETLKCEAQTILRELGRSFETRAADRDLGEDLAAPQSIPTGPVKRRLKPGEGSSRGP